MDSQNEDLLKDFAELDAILQDNSDSINMKGTTVTSILGLGKKDKEQDYSIGHYDVDIDMYDDLFNASSVMQECVEKGSKDLPTFDLLHKDMFLSLFKYKPVVIPESQMKRSTRINNTIMRKLVESTEYKDLRKNCRLDQFNSALGAEIIGQKAVDIIKNWKKEALEALKNLQNKNGNTQGPGGPGNSNSNAQPNPFLAIKKLKKVEEKLDDLIENKNDLKQRLEEMKSAGSGAGVNNLQNQIDEANLSIEETTKLADMIANECDELIDNDDLMQELNTRLTGAFSEADKIVAEVSDYVETWGLQEGDTCKIPFAEKKEAVERIRDSDKLKKITDLIGRFKDSALQTQKKKSKNGTTDIESVTNGSKMQDVLPSEKIKLCNTSTKKDFYRRMSQKALLQYKKTSSNTKTKGPIITCVDTSGSMDGSREKWSKAMAIAMLEIANIQKRSYACILYSSVADKPIILEKGEVDPNKVLDIAETFKSGGTQFEPPLRRSMELIKSSKFKKADIVFITDGECGISSDFKKKFNKLKEDKEFNCTGILINTGSGSTSDKTLKEFCDTIHYIDNIADLSNENSDVNKTLFNSI